MKKLVIVMLVVWAVVLLLISCGTEVPTSDATITFTDGNGIKTNVDVNEYSISDGICIRRSDTASMELKNGIAALRKVIEEKTGSEVSLATDLSASGNADMEIVVGKLKDSYSKVLSESLAETDYKIVNNGNKIYIAGGSDEAVLAAMELFGRCFIYVPNKTLLLPIGDGYGFEKKFAFEKISIDGVDIEEFSIYSEGEEATVDHENTITYELATRLSKLFESTLLGKELPIAKEEGGGHRIIIRAHNLDADAYSVEIKDGNVYIEGSFITVKKAYEAFVSEVLCYREEEGCSEKSVSISAENSISGDLGFEVSYTKEDLLKLFEDVSESDEMIISGTHCYNGKDNNSWVSSTSDKIFEASGQRPGIIELDLGRHSVYYDYYYKGDVVTPYDLSSFVAPAVEHAVNGGIISVCIHMANPLMNASDKVWYRGHLGGDEIAREMITEGTELNAAFRETLTSTFMLIKALDDNGVPFLFRPFHEMNGGWFWWCSNQGDSKLTSETMQDMWKYLYNIVTEEMGIDNALWVYSPNYDTGSIDDVLYAYPGDEYVDIVGCDWYTNGNYEINHNESYNKVMSTGKPAALTEVGPASGGALATTDAKGNTVYIWTCEDLLGAMKQMVSDGFKVSYFLTWTGSGSIAGLGNADILMNDPMILSREDLAQHWAALK